jgi:DNA polymerase-3 subunit gamma/tau
VGKTTTARILARALNCEKGPTPAPCGVCEACKNIISGSSFDVMEIDGASNNSVEDIREIRDNINYSSMGGSYRIYVIDEVHMLSKSAFNALLKTLEEPPPKVIFIFATTEPQKIPATIQSRCQRYDFRRISTDQIVRQLARICAEERISFDQPALTLVGRKADGSMRDALSLLDQVYSYCQEHIGEKEVRSVLGLVDAEVYDSILDAIKAKNPEPALRYTTRFYAVLICRSLSSVLKNICVRSCFQPYLRRSIIRASTYRRKPFTPGKSARPDFPRGRCCAWRRLSEKRSKISNGAHSPVLRLK